MSMPAEKDSSLAPAHRVEASRGPERMAYRPPPNRHGIDWIGREQQGGGRVPQDFTWISNPKQDQEDGAD